MFCDRRQGDRRKQQLPVPEGMCRRKGDTEERRLGRFESTPWWLATNYVDGELSLGKSSTKKPATNETKPNKPAAKVG